MILGGMNSGEKPTAAVDRALPNLTDLGSAKGSASRESAPPVL
jgi:hypothetical protein